MAKEMSPEERHLLSSWINRLTADVDLHGMAVPFEELLTLAGAVAAGVARPAVPVTAYVAGYLAAVRAGPATAQDPARVIQEVLDLVPTSSPAAEQR